jgi:hypothetical protein
MRMTMLPAGKVPAFGLSPRFSGGTVEVAASESCCDLDVLALQTLSNSIWRLVSAGSAGMT